MCEEREGGVGGEVRTKEANKERPMCLSWKW